jgi:hypothetical protein
VSRQDQPTTPGLKESTGELADLERAATALRKKFLEEFCARRDPNVRHFYEEMAIHQKRFRVMGLHEFSLS